MKILLVEDNERVAQFVRKGLLEEGHIVDHADNGRDGLFFAASGQYDVMILDRMLPGGVDGLGIVEVLRKTGNKTPILILSALAEVDDRIRGLRAGGPQGPRACGPQPSLAGDLVEYVVGDADRGLPGAGAVGRTAVGDGQIDHDVGPGRDGAGGANL